jgi:outer membrane protein assembly factor BamB
MLRSCLWSMPLLLCAAVALAAPERNEWPQFRGPNRDDISSDKGLLKEWPKDGPPLVWKATGVGNGYASVSIAGGKLFTLGNKGKSTYVFAVNLADGKSLWSAEVGRPGGNLGCTPTVDGNLLYAVGQDGDLACIEVATGEVKWRKHFKKDFDGKCGGWSYTESPLVDGDKLLCSPGGKEAAIVALNKKTGEVIWKCPSPFMRPTTEKQIKAHAAGYSSIVIAEVGGIRQYIQMMHDGVIGVAAKDGKLLWTYGDKADRFAANTANIPTPIVRGDQIFCVAGYGRGGGLVKLTAADGGVTAAEVYFNRGLNNKHGGVVLVGDYLYGDRDESGNLYCAEFTTGKIVPGWQKRGETEGRGSISVTYADGHLYCRYTNGIVALVEATPAAYREKGSFKIPNTGGPSWSHPVVVGGRLYLREKDVVWCYDVKQP